jgi:hypothetical protein
MEAMTILRRCRRSAEDIERLENQIWRRRDAIGSQAPQMDPNGGSRGTGDPDKIGWMVADLADVERKLEERKEEAAVETASSCALLDMLPDLESDILYRYYVKRMTVPQIAHAKKYQDGYLRKRKRAGEELLGLISAERVRGTLPRWYLEKYEKEDWT